MGKDTKRESVEDFLARGGTITKVDDGPELPKQTISKVKFNVTDLITLDEAIKVWGKKNKSSKVKQEKKIDLSDIDRSKIPESLHYILDQFKGADQ